VGNFLTCLLGCCIKACRLVCSIILRKRHLNWKKKTPYSQPTDA
jgi:hypothetical protein